jgi:peptidoglycan/xylan/chitin deacetylase (PgdA/CDA1 family)
MRIPAWKRLTQSARWLRSRFVDRALILGYHRIADVDWDPFGMTVRPQYFAEQLEVLRSKARPIALRDLVEGLGSGKLPRRCVAVTFDDGYADNLGNAKPLLERFGIPATVFVVTGCLGREFWWNELQRILARDTLPRSFLLQVDGRAYEARVDAAPGAARDALVTSLADLVRDLSEHSRRRVLDQLWAWSGPKPDGDPRARAMTEGEILTLASGGLIDLGSHTIGHPSLATLSRLQQECEIRGSKERLESLLGRAVTSFAYPNGSWSAETLAIVRQAGFERACASHSDVAWHATDPYRLPRFWVPDYRGSRFSKWLRLWLGP